MSDSQTPPKGNYHKAEEYINKLVDLINKNKIIVAYTDLKKFDPTSLREHYTIKLENYHIEISHSNLPDSGKDSYVIIFNNLKQVSDGSGEKVILAYIYLTDSQFSKFKIVADRQIEETHRIEEEQKFDEALMPIDKLLQEVAGDIQNEPLPAARPRGKQDFHDELNSPSHIHQI